MVHNENVGSATPRWKGETMESTVLRQAREQRVDELIAAENTRDLGRIESMLQGDAEFDDAAWGERSRGSWTGIPDWHRKMWSAFPDLRFVVSGKRTDDAGRILVDGTLSGTHRGEWHGIAASGHHFEIPARLVYEFMPERDLLSGSHLYYDKEALLSQLGHEHRRERMASRERNVERRDVERRDVESSDRGYVRDARVHFHDDRTFGTELATQAEVHVPGARLPEMRVPARAELRVGEAVIPGADIEAEAELYIGKTRVPEQRLETRAEVFVPGAAIPGRRVPAKAEVYVPEAQIPETRAVTRATVSVAGAKLPGTALPATVEIHVAGVKFPAARLPIQAELRVSEIEVPSTAVESRGEIRVAALEIPASKVAADAEVRIGGAKIPAARVPAAAELYVSNTDIPETRLGSRAEVLVAGGEIPERRVPTHADLHVPEARIGATRTQAQAEFRVTPSNDIPETRFAVQPQRERELSSAERRELERREIERREIERRGDHGKKWH